MKICVVIPTYNESKAIADLINAIKQQGLDILVVDDGSSDNTFQIVKDSAAFVLRNSKNEGKGASLAKGFDYALTNNYDAVITMDGDGQHSPSDIPCFVRLALDSDAAVLIGNRMKKIRNMPLLRLVTNKFMSWLISCITKQKIPDTQCGFRLIKRPALEKIDLKTSNFEAESEILIKAARLGFKIESVPITTIYSGTKSQINPFVDTLRFIKFILKTYFQKI